MLIGLQGGKNSARMGGEWPASPPICGLVLANLTKCGYGTKEVLCTALNGVQSFGERSYHECRYGSITGWQSDDLKTEP